MASITWADVTNHAPQLSVLAVGAQNDILAFVNTLLDVNVLGGEESAMVKMARIYLAAHFGTVDTQGGSGPAGPVISETAGGLSRSYAQLMNSSGFTGSSYGDQFVGLVRMSPARAPVIL